MNSRILEMASVSALAVLASTGTGFAQSQELIDAAKKEGTLTTIALPHSWCNYGEMISGFKAKYGLEVNELNPDAGSGDEIEAIKANVGNTGPQAPDVIDVGLSFGPSAKAEGLLQPYKVATWDTIPDDAKDPEGILVRGLLRRALLRGEHGSCEDGAAGLAGSAEARLRQRRRAGG
jgi:putative spermidine/putrescine transport system substrate-binding protein